MLPIFTHILTRQPARTLANGLTTHPQLGPPDFDLTMQQYEAYIAALRDCGLHITILPADPRFPDGHYIEDTAVIFRDLAFIARPAAAAREAESAAIAPYLADLHRIHLQGEEARLEGGDVLFCNDRVLIGLSTRTNRAGAEQLAAALRDMQADIRVDLVPMEGVLHLTTGLTELAPNVLLKAPQLRAEGDFDFAEVITLPPDEGYAANVLPINDTLLIADGYPSVAAAAEKYWQHIVPLEVSEFRKMDGGLTCLSLRY